VTLGSPKAAIAGTSDYRKAYLKIRFWRFPCDLLARRTFGSSRTFLGLGDAHISCSTGERKMSAADDESQHSANLAAFMGAGAVSYAQGWSAPMGPVTDSAPARESAMTE
jgi:hypothetical protein